MHVGLVGRSMVAAVAVGLLTSACTPSVTPTPSPLPSVSATPTETDQQRQERIDYEAAEKAYRTFRAEVSKMAANGGSVDPGAKLSAQAGGPYLAEYVRLLKSFKKSGLLERGTERIVFVRPGGYSVQSLVLNVCEDSRTVKTYDKKGKLFGTGELRTAELEVRLVNDVWRVWDGDGKVVAECV